MEITIWYNDQDEPGKINNAISSGVYYDVYIIEVLEKKKIVTYEVPMRRIKFIQKK